MTEWSRIDRFFTEIAIREVSFQAVFNAREAGILACIIGTAVTIGAVFYFGPKGEKVESWLRITGWIYVVGLLKFSFWR